MILQRRHVHEQRLERSASIGHAGFRPSIVSPPIPLQQFMGSPGQHSSDLSPLALHPGDHHAVVAGRLVAHPGDDGSFGPLLDRDAFRPGHRAAPDRRGMIGDGTGQPVGKIGVISDERPGTSPPPPGSPRRTRPGPCHGVGRRLPSSWRSPPWIARLRDRHESVRWSPPVPTRPWRRPSGPSSRRRPNDRQQPSPGESGRRHRAAAEPSLPGRSGLCHRRHGRCSGSRSSFAALPALSGFHRRTTRPAVFARSWQPGFQDQLRISGRLLDHVPGDAAQGNLDSALPTGVNIPQYDLKT